MKAPHRARPVVCWGNDAELSVHVCVQREVAEHIVAALEAGGGSMDQLCRLLLAADTYQVTLLRNHCLAGLAQAFQSLHTHTPREQEIFEAFVDAVAPEVPRPNCRSCCCRLSDLYALLGTYCVLSLTDH